MLFTHISVVAVQYLTFVAALPSPQTTGTHKGDTHKGVAHTSDKETSIWRSTASAVSGSWDAFTTFWGFGVAVDQPANAAPKRQELKTDSEVPGARRVKIRSGPYKVPNMNRWALVTGERGMLYNYPDYEIEKPCLGDECTILKQWAGLEYADGTDANIDSGLWLHHMLSVLGGPTRWDPICLNRWSLAHAVVRELPRGAERYFSSGNERSVFDFNPDWKDMKYGTGYHLFKEDRIKFIIDLMNMNMEDKVVYITMTYDVLDGALPDGWEQVKTIWLDANNCMTGEVHAPQQTGNFTIRSTSWTPNFEGRILSSTGHLHDGGIATDTMYDEGKSLCYEKARYSETPNFKFTGPQMGDDIVAVDHISSMTKCKPAISRLTKNQKWSVVGHYDYDQRAGNIDRGEQGEIMAISLVRVAVGRNGVKVPPLEYSKLSLLGDP